MLYVGTILTISCTVIDYRFTNTGH